MRVRKSVCRKTQGIAEPGNSCLTTPGTCESCPDWVKSATTEKLSDGVGIGRELWGDMDFCVPLVPPTNNMYVRHTRSGRHYVTKEAKAFKEAVALFSRNKAVRYKHYAIEIYVNLAAKQKLDLDNAPKVILDGLVEAGIIDSDAKVTGLYLHKKRCPANPRTCITIWEGKRP